MKVLFNLERDPQLRYFDQCLRLLADRGDVVHLVFDRPRKSREPGIVDGLVAEQPERIVSREGPTQPEGGRWALIVDRLRATINYLAYQEPPFSEAPKLKRRMEELAPRSMVLLGKLAGRRGRRALRRLLGAVARRAPLHRGVERVIREIAPDMVLVAPRQPSPIFNEYIRAGKRLGIPTGLCVRSWDNLTLKGLIQETPDFVTVWNQGQRREAVELHGIPEDRVLITGAPAFDHWFDWSPSTARKEFCRQAELDANRPFVLYLGSSREATGVEEVAFVDRWIHDLRARPEPELRELQILIRPHPNQLDQKPWKGLGKRHPGVSVWSVTDKPVVDDLRSDFYDSMYHCVAVVGVNTSAMIEAAIVGRPVYTLLAPELYESQEGLPHFSLISEFEGGVLNVANSFDEHAGQLARALNGSIDPGEEQRRRRFIEAFVRPQGLDRPAAEVFAEALDAGRALGG